MEKKAGLLLSCLFFSSCSAAANSSVLVMRADGEVGCCATASAAVQMTVAISPPLKSNLREEKQVIRRVHLFIVQLHLPVIKLGSMATVFSTFVLYRIHTDVSGYYQQARIMVVK